MTFKSINYLKIYIVQSITINNIVNIIMAKENDIYHVTWCRTNTDINPLLQEIRLNKPKPDFRYYHKYDKLQLTLSQAAKRYRELIEASKTKQRKQYKF